MATQPDTATNKKPKARLLRLDSLLGELAQNAADRNESFTTGRARGAVTGLARFDEMISGALEPGLHVVTGGPGVGKTAFGLQLAANSGVPSLFVTTEMPALELLRRLIARHTRTFLNRLKTGEFDADRVVGLAKQAIAKVPDLYLVDATAAYAEPGDLKGWALTVREQADHGHVLMVMDSVHSWSESARVTNVTEYDRLGVTLDVLGEMARGVGMPIIAIAERNRMSMKEGGVSSAAGHRGFEYGAETMINLDEPAEEKNANSRSGDEKTVVLTVSKNRHGKCGKMPLVFHGALQEYREETATDMQARANGLPKGFIPAKGGP